MRRKKWLLVSAILVVCIAFSVANGQKTKDSYVDNVKLNDFLANQDLKIRYTPYPQYAERDVLPDIETIKSFEDVEKISPIVVKAKLKEDYERTIYYDCILSQIEIVELYRGDMQKNDPLYLFEPTSGRPGASRKILSCSDGYSLMQEGEEYILFLQPLKNTYYGEDKYVYLPSTTTYSKYKCSNQEIRLFTEEELGFTGDSELELYSEVKDEEVFLCYKDAYDLFVDFKKQVMDKYN